MTNQNHEQNARDNIDRQLIACGWVIQDKKQINLGAGTSVAVREYIQTSALRFKDFKQELFPKVRNLIRSNNYNHPWLTLNDEQMLQKAGLRRHDTQTGQEGYTLAAALLLGKDEVIKSILPHYKIDALVRRVNTDRYDDRDYIDTNLIEAYDGSLNSSPTLGGWMSLVPVC